MKTYSVKLHMKDSFITQMFFFFSQLLIEMFGLLFEPTKLLDGVSRFLHSEFSLL